MCWGNALSALRTGIIQMAEFYLPDVSYKYKSKDTWVAGLHTLCDVFPACCGLQGSICLGMW
jgi:hypothetical protein